MVASQWLEEAVAYAEQQHLLHQQHRRQHPGEADKKADLSDKNCSDTEYSITDNSETATMSSQRQLVPQNLANYGPTMEEQRAHVAGQLAVYRSKSTQKQYKRKYEEYCKFSMAVFGDTEITVDRSLKFLQFQAHRENELQKKILTKLWKDASILKNEKGTRKLATLQKAQNMSSMWMIM